MGVDAVSGATITSIALMNAVTQAAEEAGVSNMEQFRKNRVDKVEKDIEDGQRDLVCNNFYLFFYHTER